MKEGGANMLDTIFCGKALRYRKVCKDWEHDTRCPATTLEGNHIRKPLDCSKYVNELLYCPMFEEES